MPSPAFARRRLSFTPIRNTGRLAGGFGISALKVCFLRPLLLLSLLLFLLPATAGAKEKSPPMRIERSGALPADSSMSIRSGLAWMNESAPIFVHFRATLLPLLAERDIRIVNTPPSKTEKPLYTPLPHSASPDMPPTSIKGKLTPAGKATDPSPDVLNEAKVQARVADLARNKQLKPLKLSSYPIQAADAELPASVLSVKPPDTQNILFFLSQQDGLPLMRRGGPIPGRIPEEMTSVDPQAVDYALVVRFCLVRPTASRSSRGHGGILVAAGRGSLTTGSGIGSYAAAGASGRIGGIQGLSRSQQTNPAARRPPYYGGTPGDYIRGYETGGPNADFWNRRSDMHMRNYTHPDPPQFSEPPAQPPTFREAGRGGSPSLGGAPAGDLTLPPVNPRTAAALAAPGAGVLGAALEMDCWDLRPVKQDKPPVRVWRCVVQQRADAPDLTALLPGMIKAALQQ